MKKTMHSFLKGCWDGFLTLSAIIIAIAMVAFPMVLSIETENVWYCATYLIYIIIFCGVEEVLKNETD